MEVFRTNGTIVRPNVEERLRQVGREVARFARLHKCEGALNFVAEWQKAPENPGGTCLRRRKNAHLLSGHSSPHFHEGDVWENQIRRFRDRQNLYVIWILGRFGSEVKGKTERP